jgi:hypothetical protein
VELKYTVISQDVLTAKFYWIGKHDQTINLPQEWEELQPQAYF